MTPKKLCVNDSITLSTIHTNKFKASTVTFSLYQPLTRQGYLYNLLLAGVMRRGCEGLPSMALINKRLDELYASTVDVQSNVSGSVLSLSVSADMLEGRYTPDKADVSGGVIGVIADILLRPIMENGLFPRKVVESEKVFLKDCLAAEKNNTRVYAATRLKELMCRDNSPEFPTMDFLLSGIDKITSEELTAHYLSLLSSSMLHVFYVGGETAEEIGEKISRAFRGFCQLSGSRSSELITTKSHKVCPMLEVTEDMPVSQGKLTMGMRTGTSLVESTHPTAIVLNELYGASPVSKLFLNVREKLGLCYYCSSSYSFFSGNLCVASGIDSKNRSRATEEILTQLDEIRRGNVSAAELSAAKRSLEYSYVQIYDSPFSLQAFYASRDLSGVNETVEECKQRILDVTAEQVCELARRTVLDTCFFINGTSKNSGEGDVDEA